MILNLMSGIKNLKNYDGKDVHKKLESHLNSPEFSEQETKYIF
jgi:hypothetical protein